MDKMKMESVDMTAKNIEKIEEMKLMNLHG